MLFCWFFWLDQQFKRGKVCEIIKNDPRHETMPKLFPDRIGERIVISEVQPHSLYVWAYEAKPVSYRMNRNGRQVVDFDPACVNSLYKIDSLRVLNERESAQILSKIGKSRSGYGGYGG